MAIHEKYITVSTLIQDLQSVHPEAVVLLASDAEGNDFRPLEGMDPKAIWDTRRNEISLAEDFDHSLSLVPAVAFFPEHM